MNHLTIFAKIEAHRYSILNEIEESPIWLLFWTREELYDFSADPDGLHNLANHPSYKGTLTRLRNELLDWMKDTGDPITEDYEAYLNGNFADFSGPGNP